MQEVVIVKIHKDDSFYPDRKKLIGLFGAVADCPTITRAGYVGCCFIPNNKSGLKDIALNGEIEFYAVMLESAGAND